METFAPRRAWNYDRFCSAAAAKKMADAYLDSCLCSQTFALVAEVKGAPVGVIMGRESNGRRCPVALRLRRLRSVLGLSLSKEGRAAAELFARIREIDRQLLSSCGKTYEGELVLFVINEQCRGMGLGRKLFRAASERMAARGISSWYLFTDTSCNYPFYEHLGLTRRCEAKRTMAAGGEQGEMTFFLYDGQG